MNARDEIVDAAKDYSTDQIFDKALEHVLLGDSTTDLRLQVIELRMAISLLLALVERCLP